MTSLTGAELQRIYSPNNSRRVYCVRGIICVLLNVSEILQADVLIMYVGECKNISYSLTKDLHKFPLMT